MSSGKLIKRGWNHQSGASSYGGNMCPYYVQNGVKTGEAYISRIRHHIARMIHDFIAQQTSPLRHIDIQAQVLEVVKLLEKSLFETSVSEEEYLNPDTLVSRIRVQLRRLNHYWQDSTLLNGASNSRTESTSNILQFTPPSYWGWPLDSGNEVNSATPMTFNVRDSLASDSAPYDGFVSRDMECQTEKKPRLMPHYFCVPHPEEAVTVQYQASDRIENITCSLLPSNNSRQLSEYDVQLDSRSQVQHNYTPNMLDATAGVNVHMNVNEASCRNYAEYPQRSGAKHQANENDLLMHASHLSQLNQESETECKNANAGMQPEEVIHSLQEPGEKLEMCQLNRLQCNTNNVSVVEACEDVQPLPKRAKIDHSEDCIPTTEKPSIRVSKNCASHSAEYLRPVDDQCELIPSDKCEQRKLHDLSPDDRNDSSLGDSERCKEANDGASIRDSENITQENGKCKEGFPPASINDTSLPAEPLSESSEHQKIDCVSLIELFTPEQVRQHKTSLRQWFGQSKVKARRRRGMEQSVNQNSCQLCAAGELSFKLMPLYCTQCASRIKRNAVFYMLGIGGARYYFCTTCYASICGENFTIFGRTFSKSELEKKKNNEDIHEPWVQCDKCHGWQHQVCALFNNRMNGEGQAKYTCPNCYVTEVERGNCVPLPRTSFLGAKDLPRTALSDHIEQRLHRRLEEEKELRATAQGLVDEKSPNGGKLVVRVVLSVNKKLEVKKNFLDIFQEDDFPAEFPYKSKVILLFQETEGVDVCLFAMYVQEYGSECDFPNRRRIYISYLDSVKYFRPDVKLETGEALRTFVYHEVLIGYLEYCKSRGFTSCYIWVCPSSKGDDYILYCHPDIQRTPKSDKLREWYMSMLKKAAKEDIVLEITNLYDQFLVSTGESKAKISASRLPYFDGDYWPGTADVKLKQICQEGDEKPSEKSASKKSVKKRRTTLHNDLSDSASKDTFLIHEIGKIMGPMKEDFIMVHLQRACTHCCMFIMSGNCWQCEECSNFQLCDKCYEVEQCRDESYRHPQRQKIKHSLHPVEILNIPEVTKDEDGIIESEIFDTRLAFLNFCQGNHYQYDTLRNAKQSSMMLLYHLHNPTAPAFVTICHICHLDIEAGHGLWCDVCFDYDICKGCYEKYGDSDHPHKLTTHTAQTSEARALWVSQVRKLNELVVHGSGCHSLSCQYADCRKLKWLFHHVSRCTERASNGCVYCKKMWFLLKVHARACQESTCRVPCCSDLKMHSTKLQQKSEARRRAAVSEMSRQRTDGIG